MHTEHSLGQITSWVTNQASVNLRKLKSFQAFFPTTCYEIEINYREKNVQNTNAWRLNNTLLNNQEITEENKEEIKKYLKTNGNENTMTQNLWDAAKAVIRGKFKAIQSYLKNQEKSQINNLTLHLKQLEKEEEMNPKLEERK